MKRTILAALVLLASVATFAQKAVITGKISGLNADSHVMLMDIANPTNLMPVTVGADGSYRLELDAPEPYTRFIIVDSPKGGCKFYVQQGMKANIDIDIINHGKDGAEEYESKVTYTGDHKDCYEYFSEGDYYQNAQNPLLDKYYGKNADLSFADFRGELRYQVDKLLGKLNKVDNPVFRKWMKSDYEQKMNVSLGWFTALSNKSDSTLVAWMESLDRNGDLADARQYASFYKHFCLPEGTDPSIGLLNKLNNLYSSKEIIHTMADGVMTQILDQAPANINDIYAAYKAVDPEREVPADIQALYDHYKTMVPGAKAVNFDFYDQKGKKLTLSNLKGKALYIDCWATWCGPCKAETPYMVKLFEHFKNDKRIQLVSISLDKNQAAWKAMVKKENLSWPQYIVKGEFDCMLCKEYGVTGIPRFMMFDKNGKIISLDAPRPSAPDIIEWIESNLK